MDELEAYYGRFNEEARLTQDHIHQSEYLTTMHLLRQHLQPGADILDCCAGTGVYAFALAKMGHRVTAGDLIERHVTRMRSHAQSADLHEIYRGDATDLSRFADETFDAVLCFGALYHLQAEEDRNRAVAECLRVLRRGGLFAFAYIHPFVLYYRQLAEAVRSSEPADRINAYNRLDRIQKHKKDGVFFAMSAVDAAALADRFHLEMVANAGTYSTLYPLYPELNSLPEGEYERYIRCQLATCTDANVAAHSMHGCCLAKKRPL